MLSEEPYPPHDLAAELDDLSRAYATLQADLALARAVCDQLQQELREERARVALDAVRPQADALLAELALARAALDQIDRHIVGACESDSGGMPDPCEECGEMREIASQALQVMKKVRSA